MQLFLFFVDENPTADKKMSEESREESQNQSIVLKKKNQEVGTNSSPNLLEGVMNHPRARIGT